MSSYDSVDYFFNSKEGRVIPANPAMRDYAKTKSHLIPCDEEGRALKVGDPDDTGVDALQKQLLDKETEIEVLKAEIRELKGEADEPGEEAETEEEPEDGDPMTAHDHLVAAIGELEAGNPDHFRTDGMPRVKILEARTDLEVTEKQVEAAWKAYKEQ